MSNGSAKKLVFKSFLDEKNLDIHRIVNGGLAKGHLIDHGWLIIELSAKKEKRRELRKWIRTNVGSEYHLMDWKDFAFVAAFRNAEDAVMFKLKFGGNDVR